MQSLLNDVRNDYAKYDFTSEEDFQSMLNTSICSLATSVCLAQKGLCLRCCVGLVSTARCLSLGLRTCR